MALDTLDVTITRVLFHEPSKFSPSGNKFLIARTSTGSTIKGEMRNVREGDRVRLWGEWRAAKGRPEPAFEFVSHETLFDEGVAGVVDYLRHYVPGLGLVKATAIVEALGADTLRVLRTEPDRAAEIAGITPAIVQAIRKHFEDEVTLDPAAYARLVDLFAGHKFPKRVVKALLRDWGSDAPAKVVSNPYMLLAYPRMGWKGVDAFAIESAGYDPKGLDRQVAAIVEGLEKLSGDGHTYGTKIDIERVAFELIGGRPEELAWHMATIDGRIARVDDEEDAWLSGEQSDAVYALPKLAAAERSIAGHLARLMGAGKPLAFRFRCDWLGDDPKSDEQRAAVRVIEANPVMILAGPPGTGKTFVTSRVINELVDLGHGPIRCVTPTGKAGKRLAELLAEVGIDPDQVPCSTVHKALGVARSEDPEGASSGEAKLGRGRDEFGFMHGEGNPLEANIIVADECSMIDANLMASLLSAVATGTRLIFVGDPNQLPSVGPGSVLRDLIAAGVPTATLATIQRSDGGGRVVRACHDIKDGRVPRPAVRVELPTENWVHIEEDDPARIAQTIVELHESARRNGRYDPLWDMQVVSAQRGRLPIGCDALNDALARTLNPTGWGTHTWGDEAADAAMTGIGPPFRVGDKIVRTKNGACDEMVPLRGTGDDDGPREDWRWRGTPYSLAETAVVNGDMGQVLDVVTGDDEAFAVVQFRTPDRLCRLPMGEHHIQLAYAMTAHKCQGSGFPYVIVPVHNAYYWDARTNTGLWARELVYTAISRAEKLLVTVGQSSAIRAAVGRRTVDARRTRLAGYVRDALACGGPAARPGAEIAGKIAGVSR